MGCPRSSPRRSCTLAGIILISNSLPFLVLGFLVLLSGPPGGLSRP